MKFGIRKPSIKKRIAARTSWKRYARHSLGLKAPRGMGWLTNPRRAAYNRIYNRTTIGVGKGCLVLVILGGVTAGITFLAIVVVGAIARSNPPYLDSSRKDVVVSYLDSSRKDVVVS